MTVWQALQRYNGPLLSYSWQQDVRAWSCAGDLVLRDRGISILPDIHSSGGKPGLRQHPALRLLQPAAALRFPPTADVSMWAQIFQTAFAFSCSRPWWTEHSRLGLFVALLMLAHVLCRRCGMCL